MTNFYILEVEGFETNQQPHNFDEGFRVVLACLT